MPESVKVLLAELQSTTKVAGDSIDTAKINSSDVYFILIITSLLQVSSYIIGYFIIAAQALTYSKLKSQSEI